MEIRDSCGESLEHLGVVDHPAPVLVGKQNLLQIRMARVPYILFMYYMSLKRRCGLPALYEITCCKVPVR